MNKTEVCVSVDSMEQCTESNLRVAFFQASECTVS